MDFIRIKKDGSETGATLADKTNFVMESLETEFQTQAMENVYMTVGTDIDTLHDALTWVNEHPSSNGALVYIFLPEGTHYLGDENTTTSDAFLYSFGLGSVFIAGKGDVDKVIVAIHPSIPEDTLSALYGIMLLSFGVLGIQDLVLDLNYGGRTDGQNFTFLFNLTGSAMLTNMVFRNIRTPFLNLDNNSVTNVTGSLWDGITTPLVDCQYKGSVNVQSNTFENGSIDGTKVNVLRQNGTHTFEIGNLTGLVIDGKTGTTASRPSSVLVGYDYFDTDLGIPIWWDGTIWVNASGNGI